jgi:hypothetical protein
MRLWLTVVLVVVVLLGGLTAPAAACEAAGPNTHVGVVVAVNAAQSTLTLKDAETRKDLTFVAPAALLSGLAVKDQIAVTYAQEGNRLKATAIRKLGG